MRHTIPMETCELCLPRRQDQPKHAALDPDMTEEDWKAFKKLAQAQQEWRKLDQEEEQMQLQFEICRRCCKRADFIVWGKLFPPEELGPRCLVCLPQDVTRDLYRLDQWAVYDLRPVNQLLDQNQDLGPEDEHGHLVIDRGVLVNDPRCSVCNPLKARP